MAIRHLALMALAAVAAGAYANTRRNARRAGHSAGKAPALQTWEGEGGTGTDLADKASLVQSDDLLAVGDDRPQALGEDRDAPLRPASKPAGNDLPPAANSNPLPAGRNLP